MRTATIYQCHPRSPPKKGAKLLIRSRSPRWTQPIPYAIPHHPNSHIFFLLNPRSLRPWLLTPPPTDNLSARRLPFRTFPLFRHPSSPHLRADFTPRPTHARTRSRTTRNRGRNGLGPHHGPQTALTRVRLDAAPAVLPTFRTDRLGRSPFHHLARAPRICSASRGDSDSFRAGAREKRWGATGAESGCNEHVSRCAADCGPGCERIIVENGELEVQSEVCLFVRIFSSCL